jgi:phosphoserine phosphatase
MELTRRTLVLLLAAALYGAGSRPARAQSDALPSWNDGAVKKSIIDFVARVSTQGGADFVPPAERIAVFDNDGTLWCEQPVYFQAAFALDRVKAMAAQHPEWKQQQPFKAFLAGDRKALAEQGEKAVLTLVAAAHSGMTTDEFAMSVAEWLATAKHPRFNRPYNELIYQPMVELLAYLRANGFKTFIVSGGGVEFVRAASERLYGVGPDNVVGSAVEVGFERRDGRVVLVRQAKLLGSPNEGEPKAINIQAHIGRRPIFAAGNSAGDREMLEYATTGEHPSLAIVVDHDDAEREYAYAGKAMTNPDAEAIAETAARFGWTVVSMRDDWGRVFAEPAP